VTAQGVVDGMLSELGAHGGRGGVLGGRGVAGSSHCGVGASEGSAETASIHWGLASVLVVEGKGEGEGSGRAVASGSSSPSCPTKK
jgi:hypothetical protein